MDFKKIFADMLALVDVKKLEIYIVEQVVFPFLQKIVDDSANKFDDAAFAMVKDWVEKNLK
jgi:hypothetical protein